MNASKEILASRACRAKIFYHFEGTLGISYIALDNEFNHYRELSCLLNGRMLQVPCKKSAAFFLLLCNVYCISFPLKIFERYVCKTFGLVSCGVAAHHNLLGSLEAKGKLVTWNALLLLISPGRKKRTAIIRE